MTDRKPALISAGGAVGAANRFTICHSSSQPAVPVTSRHIQRGNIMSSVGLSGLADASGTAHITDCSAVGGGSEGMMGGTDLGGANMAKMLTECWADRVQSEHAGPILGQLHRATDSRRPGATSQPPLALDSHGDAAGRLGQATVSAGEAANHCLRPIQAAQVMANSACTQQSGLARGIHDARDARTDSIDKGGLAPGQAEESGGLCDAIPPLGLPDTEAVFQQFQGYGIMHSEGKRGSNPEIWQAFDPHDTSGGDGCLGGKGAAASNRDSLAKNLTIGAVLGTFRPVLEHVSEAAD